MTSWVLPGLGPAYHGGDMTQFANSRLCVLILCVLAVSHVILVAVYYKEPLPCWCPAQFSHHHCEMAQAHCRTNKLVLFDFPVDGKVVYPHQDHYVEPEFSSIPMYYQCISLILLLQALLFYIPSIIWKEMAVKLGIMPDKLVSSAASARNPTEHDAAIQGMTQHVRLFCTRQLRRRHVSYALRWLHGNKLVLAQLFSKAIYCANVIGQYFLLDVFLEMPFHNFGWQIIRKVTPESLDLFWENMFNITGLLGNTDAEALLTNANYTPVEFPAVTLCQVSIAQQRRAHQYFLQCIMPVNTLNEVIFIFVWFMMLAVAVVTITSFTIALFKFGAFYCRQMSVRERLHDVGVLERPDIRDDSAMNMIRLFENDFLQRDGMFLVEYIESTTDDVIADEVLTGLWDCYKDNFSDLQPIATPVKWVEEWVDEPTRIPEARDHERPQGPRAALIRMDTQESSVQATAIEEPPQYDDLEQTM